MCCTSAAKFSIFRESFCLFVLNFRFFFQKDFRSSGVLIILSSSCGVFLLFIPSLFRSFRPICSNPEIILSFLFFLESALIHPELLYICFPCNLGTKPTFSSNSRASEQLLEDEVRKMSFLTSSPDNSYKPNVSGNTVSASYWLNWRVLLCALWVSISMVFSLVLIWRHEDFGKADCRDRDTEQETPGTLYDDETWRPCLKGVHPAWLLAFRVVAFIVLLLMLIVASFLNGGSVFYYYTQWTFTLITIYFGLGSLLSFYGCYEYHNRAAGEKIGNVEVDSERGSYAASEPRDNSIAISMAKNSLQHDARKKANIWGYLFQIMFQMNAGAVVLTDCVFWFIIVPFLAINNYNLSILDINMHSINVILLIGDTALNCLRFPLFRIGYFFMWTIIYVIFQWMLHAFVNIWWPYPFLDLSSSYAPLWYVSVALMHFPCHGIFALVIKLKHFLLLKWFPQSYQCPR